MLFFRLGDFYELFFDDAVTASRELELVLTGRSCGMESALNVRRAFSCRGFLHRPTHREGYKVAICEQLTDPAQSKGLVERGIIRIVTPGTVTDSSVLDEKTNNYVLSLYKNGPGKLGFPRRTFPPALFPGRDRGRRAKHPPFEELSRIQPTEVIVSEGIAEDGNLMKRLKGAYYVYGYAKWAFDPETAKKNLLSHFRLADLSGYGCEGMTRGSARQARF